MHRNKEYTANYGKDDQMEMTNLKEAVSKLNDLKKDAQETMKKGLPFVLASVVIWMLIFAVQFLSDDIRMLNLCTFFCCCLLMPLAIVFAKVVKADIFRKKVNPFCGLALLSTLNQFLYLLIVMWAFSQKPDAMLMIYAMVFGAHLLPFGWIYDSKAYTVISIAETVGALVINQLAGNAATAGFIIAGEIILSALLYKDCFSGSKT